MKFSLVIPSFNDDRILETIESINEQNFNRHDIEVIIMDACSEADLLKKIKNILKPNDRLYVEKDDGIFDGINKGILKTSGDIIFTLGSDDMLAYNDAIKDIVYQFQENSIDFLCSDLIYTDQNWLPVRYWPATLPNFFNFLIGKQVGHFAFAAKRDLYNEVGLFNKDLFVSADFDFFLRLGKTELTGKKFKKIVTFMKLGGNSSKNLKNVYQGNKQMFGVAFSHYGPFAIIHFILKVIWKAKEYNAARKLPN